jgi:hypothetical protein
LFARPHQQRLSLGGLRSHAIIAFSYRLLIVFYALTLDPVCRESAAEV